MLGYIVPNEKIVGATVGTSPTVTNMIYNCIVKPALLYGVVAWYKCLKKVTYLKKITKNSSTSMQTHFRGAAQHSCSRHGGNT